MQHKHRREHKQIGVKYSDYVIVALKQVAGRKTYARKHTRKYQSEKQLVYILYHIFQGIHKIPE